MSLVPIPTRLSKLLEPGNSVEDTMPKYLKNSTPDYIFNSKNVKYANPRTYHRDSRSKKKPLIKELNRLE